MGFRDDDDATRARADALQRELDDALRELGRLQLSRLEASSEADALRKRVAELEKTRAAVAPPPRRSGVVGLAVLATVLAGVVGGVLAYRGGEAGRVDEEHAALHARQQQEEAERARAEAEEQARRAAEAATVAQPAPEVEPEEPVPAAPAVPPRHVELTWAARVLRAEGKPLRRGTRCTVQAQLDSDGAADLHAQVDVVCGDETLYRWSAPLGSGMQMRDCSVGETPAAGGAFLHRLTCSDLGARTGRPQLSLDTDGHSAAVWSEAAPSFRVELAVTGDGRAPGPPLVAAHDGPPAGFAPVDRTARVTAVTGEAPVARGAACRVRVEPTPGNQNCRVEVRCGATVLYGSRASNGFNQCEHAAGQFVRVRDDRTTAQGGDPRMELDLAARRLVVGDEGPEYEVTLSLAR